MWVRVKERTRVRTLACEGACVRERLCELACVLAGVRACARETAHVCVCVYSLVCSRIQHIYQPCLADAVN